MSDIRGATTPMTEREILARQVRTLSWVTLAWLAIDGIVGMTAGVAASSVALVGWGLDCAIEAAAALIVIWRFTGLRIESVLAETVARRVVAVSFLLLVPYVVIEAVNQLAGGNAAAGSPIGVALAATDVALMPLLGRAKKRLGARLGSGATHAAGRQNMLCAYLSAAVLLGLALNLLFGLWWADPVVALVVAAACLQAGWSTWRGGDRDDPLAAC
jgi:divalent metal cation (Fe/Co/Zn/Cd) transporter